MPAHRLLLVLAERQHGLVSRQQARRLGLSQDAIDRLARSVGWELASARVLRRTGSAPTVEQTVLLAVLDAGGDAAISHLSAAKWWGLDGCSLTPLTLTTTKRSDRRTPLATTHVVRRLPERWSTVVRGVPIVRPELLALQLFAACREERAEILVDRLWSNRLLSGPSIAGFLSEMGERGRNGTAGLRRYLDARPGDYVPPASGLESRVKRILGDVGIPMRRQVDSGGDDWSGRVDFRAVDHPLVLEVQSEKFHGSFSSIAADRERTDRLRRDGFVVCEVTDEDVWERAGLVVSTVLAHLNARR